MKREATGYTVGRVAELAGVTVRTLHHYDQIGLLTPSTRSEAGYRRYDDSDLERLQQVAAMLEGLFNAPAGSVALGPNVSVLAGQFQVSDPLFKRELRLEYEDYQPYRVRVGESLGRMRVARIATKAITFTIEEFGYSRQETLALFLGAVGVDGMHDEARLHAHGRAVAAVDGLDLAGDQAVGDVVHAGAAVLLWQRGPQEAQLSHLGHDFAVEPLLGEGRQDAGGVEELGDVARERRSARHRPLEAATERSVQLRLAGRTDGLHRLDRGVDRWSDPAAPG